MPTPLHAVGAPSIACVPIRTLNMAESSGYAGKIALSGKARLCITALMAPPVRAGVLGGSYSPQVLAVTRGSDDGVVFCGEH